MYRNYKILFKISQREAKIIWHTSQDRIHELVLAFQFLPVQTVVQNDKKRFAADI